MKGKQKNTSRKNAIIVIVLIAIWGTVFYRIFFNKDSSEASINIKTAVKKQNSSNVLPDTYQLKNNYTDPFLGKNQRKTIVPKNNNSNSKKVKSNKNQKVLKLDPTKSNTIEYKGYVNDKNNITGYITFNQQIEIIHTNDSVGNYIIKSILKDSILLVNKKEKVWIKQNNTTTIN